MHEYTRNQEGGRKKRIQLTSKSKFHFLLKTEMQFL